jgi:hypothetical protein
MSSWKRGDVAAITDSAHVGAICILTSDAPINDSGELGAWLLIDETCHTWRTTAWVEERHPHLLVHEGALVGAAVGVPLDPTE